MNSDKGKSDLSDLDSIVVPGHPDGCKEVFINQRRWPNLKIDRRRLGSVKYIAIYQTAPVSAITHYAEILRFEPLERVGRYDVIFKGKPVEIRHVKHTNADTWAVQGPRYTALNLLLAASHLARAFPS